MSAPLHMFPNGHSMQLVALARYEPALQIEHCFALASVLYSLLAAQGAHVRSLVLVGSPTMRLPALHVVMAVQCEAPYLS